MSIFTPMDPRGPDQRRKQLIAKLAQQAGANSGAAARVPMPGRLGPMASEGRAFRGASDTRLGGNANITQSPNILQSVLAKLGVLGHSHAEEVSQGRGLPITPPAPSQGLPIPSGAPIPTPGGPAGGTTPMTGLNGVPVTASPDFQATTAGQQVPDSAGQIVGPQHTIVDPGFFMAGEGPVPLGNGLFYDPATGTILGTQDAGVAGAGVRALPGHNTAV